MAQSDDFDRLRRQAFGLHPEAPAMLKRLLEDESVDEMVATATRGMPPAMAVPDLLPPHLQSVLAEDRIRRFIGAVCAAAMLQRGWRVKRKGVRVPGNSPFATAAIFERIPAQPAAQFDSDGLLNAMLGGLSRDQRSALVARIKEMNE